MAALGALLCMSRFGANQVKSKHRNYYKRLYFLTLSHKHPYSALLYHSYHQAEGACSEHSVSQSLNSLMLINLIGLE